MEAMLSLAEGRDWQQVDDGPRSGAAPEWLGVMAGGRRRAGDRRTTAAGWARELADLAAASRTSSDSRRPAAERVRRILETSCSSGPSYRA